MEPVNTHFPERIDESHKHIKINREILHPDNWTLIPETGCWAWNWTVRGIHSDPAFSSLYKSDVLVRSYMLGVKYPKKVTALKTCNNRCINPAHFEFIENIVVELSLANKNGNQKLTAEQAWFIKFVELNYDEETGKCAYRYRGQARDLANKYGVTNVTISLIKLGKVWNHLNIDDFDYIGEE